MTREEAVQVLRIELGKAGLDFYPDRRIALRMAIDALSPVEERLDKARSAFGAINDYLAGR